MSGLVDARENAQLDQLWGAQPFTPPATWYVGLMTAAPTDAGGSIVEPSGAAAYARVGVANNLTQFPAASGGAKSNANPIVFPTASGSGWGTITHYGFFDALTGGNLWAFQALDTARIVNAGDGFQFLAGDCKFTSD
jgi:hypothetical protein